MSRRFRVAAPVRVGCAAVQIAALTTVLLLPASVRPACAADEEPLEFPLRALMPKEETGVAAFLAAHPEYDGRGIRVAIFDTGVDPGAAGMQVTTDGRPKIIDLVDGSGSGDVSTTTPAKATDGKLTGLSGRELTLGDWANPTGEWRVGLKPAWELYPNGLVSRMKEKRKEAWAEEMRTRQAAARAALAQWDDANPSPTKSEVLEREELQARIDRLEEMDAENDPGPVFDCVVFHDGENWCAVIDTDEDGDLAEEKAMRNYRIAQEWSTFDTESLLNFAVNIYEDGDLLSIVADCGSHGTHVAGIVAANFPDRPDLNGMAPGAQIVAVKIGDTRIGSSSVGTGPARGIKAVLDNECQLVNMSYGGSGPTPNADHTVELYNDLVYEQGVTFVSSAGNEGPALSTAGDPGGTTSSLIGVGAFVSGRMMETQYSLREALPDRQYTWSSRGPAQDGALGPDVSAPGGAIGPVTTWSLQGNALLNGTSMAAPSVAGGIACLMSGMLAEDIPWTPQHVKRALENTAVDVEGIEPFALGNGLARVDRAWDHLVKYRPFVPDGLRFDVTIPARQEARGIYLREASDQGHPTEVLVSVDPTFRREAESREKVDFQRQLRLSTTASWVEAPRLMHLTSSSKGFRVLVDPRGLAPGAHYAEVVAVAVDEPGRGPLFRVPVTVLVPQPLAGTSWKQTLKLQPGEIRRFFLDVPEGATWADLRLRGGANETDRYAVIHVVQLEPGMSWDTNALSLWNWTGEGDEQVRSFPVIGDRTMEICVAHYWSSLGEAEFELSLDLHGLVPSDRNVMMDGAEPARQISLVSPLGREIVEPEAKLETRRRRLRPVDSELRPLGERDHLPEGKITHELVLTYEFEQEEAGEVTLTSGINEDGRFWDTFESGLWMIFDENKQRIATDTEGPAKLQKGKHTVRLQVRHQDVAWLEDVRDAVLRVDSKLPSAIDVPVFSDPEGTLVSGHKFGERTLQAGDIATLWLGSPVAGELPEGVEEGDLLMGAVTYGKADESKFGSGQRPDGFPLTVVVPAKTNERKDPEGKPDEEESEKEKKARLADELRDLQVAHLAKLREEDRRDDFRTLEKRLSGDLSNHLPFLMERLRFLAPEKGEPAAPKEIVAAADAVIRRVDRDAVAAALGREADPEDDAEKEARAEREEQRDFLVEALRTKAIALARMDAPGDALEETYRELERWADLEDDANAELLVIREQRRGRPAVALGVLDGLLDDGPAKRELYETRVELLEELGWTDRADRERSWLLIRRPEGYPPF